MATATHCVVLAALVHLSAGLVGCDQSTNQRAISVGAESVRRTILSCELPPSASVVAFVSVELDRYIMTPAADGESASLMLTLTTGDRVTIEISYSVEGESMIIARAQEKVPASGDLEFDETDFILVDANENGVPDCAELINLQEPGPRRGLFAASAGNEGSTARPESTDGSTSAPPGVTEEEVLCAYDTDAANLWYWRVPIETGPNEHVFDTRVLEFDLRLARAYEATRATAMVLIDHKGRASPHHSPYVPDVDWTHFAVPLNSAAVAILPAETRRAFEAMRGADRATTGYLYVLGDYVAGIGDGSCIDNVAIR